MVNLRHLTFQLSHHNQELGTATVVFRDSSFRDLHPLELVNLQLRIVKDLSLPPQPHKLELLHGLLIFIPQDPNSFHLQWLRARTGRTALCPVHIWEVLMRC